MWVVCSYQMGLHKLRRVGDALSSAWFAKTSGAKNNGAVQSNVLGDTCTILVHTPVN